MDDRKDLFVTGARAGRSTFPKDLLGLTFVASEGIHAVVFSWSYYLEKQTVVTVFVMEQVVKHGKFLSCFSIQQCAMPKPNICIESYQYLTKIFLGGGGWVLRKSTEADFQVCF